MKILIVALAACTLMAGTAQAEVQDRVVSANASPQALYQGIVAAATAMCREGANTGEVFNVSRCVDVVVEKTVAEINRPSLTSYAQATTPAQATKRNI